jgi:hypothetical protein
MADGCSAGGLFNLSKLWASKKSSLCGWPSSSTLKSCCVRPRTGWPLRSRTITFTKTSRLVRRMVPFAGASCASADAPTPLPRSNPRIAIGGDNKPRNIEIFDSKRLPFFELFVSIFYFGTPLSMGLEGMPHSIVRCFCVSLQPRRSDRFADGLLSFRSKRFQSYE